MNPTLYKWLADPFERAGKTFVQQFVAVLAVGGASVALLDRQNWVLALVASAFAAVVALLTSYAALLVGLKVTGYFDLGRRVVLTFVQSFVGVLIASQVTSVLDADWKGAAATALVPTMFALLMGISALANPVTVGAGTVPVIHTLPDPAAPVVGEDEVDPPIDDLEPPAAGPADHEVKVDWPAQP
jgi:hypothetical protein